MGHPVKRNIPLNETGKACLNLFSQYSSLFEAFEFYVGYVYLYHFMLCISTSFTQELITEVLKM